MFSGGWMLARGSALPLTLLPPEVCAHKNDHARTKRAPPTDLKSRGKKAKHTVNGSYFKILQRIVAFI